MTAFALVDLFGVDGYEAHSEGRPPCVTREHCDANKVARRGVRGHLHDCAREIPSRRWAASLGNLTRTAGYHKVHTTDEDGDDGGRRCHDCKQCGMFPKVVYWKSSIQPTRPYRH